MGNDSLETLQNESPKKSPEAFKYCQIIKKCMGQRNNLNSIYTQTWKSYIDSGEHSLSKANGSAEFARQKALSLLEKD